MKAKINSVLDRFYDHSVIAIPVTILVFYAILRLVGMLGNGMVMEYAIKLIVGLALSIAFMQLRKGHMYNCGLKKHGMKNFKLILPVLIITLLQFVRPVAQFGSALLNGKLLLYAVVLAVEAGICEEFMVRGLPLGNTLCRKTTRKQFIGMAFLSSFFFGLLHLGNLFFSDGETIPVLMQVVYAVGMGMVFAAIYMRTGSIVPSIILHALWDCSQFLDPANVANGAASGAPKGLEELTAKLAETVPEAATAGTIIFIITQLAVAVIWFCLAMFLLRKSKWEEIKANFTR